MKWVQILLRVCKKSIFSLKRLGVFCVGAIHAHEVGNLLYLPGPELAAFCTNTKR